MKILLAIFLLWVFWRLLRLIWRFVSWLLRSLQNVFFKTKNPVWDAQNSNQTHQAELLYAFDASKNWALSLAHPMATHKKLTHFAQNPAIENQAKTEVKNQNQNKNPSENPSPLWVLRSPLLHYFGLRGTLTDAQIQAHLPNQLRQTWYQMDLHQLNSEDNPRDVMALACARLAFATRCAALFGWIDEATQWHILEENAGRAEECFKSWSDYGTAWARGRLRWIQHSRADSLGAAFTEQDVQSWLADAKHPWSKLEFGMKNIQSP